MGYNYPNSDIYAPPCNNRVPFSHQGYNNNPLHERFVGDRNKRSTSRMSSMDRLAGYKQKEEELRQKSCDAWSREKRKRHLQLANGIGHTNYKIAQKKISRQCSPFGRHNSVERNHSRQKTDLDRNQYMQYEPTRECRSPRNTCRYTDQRKISPMSTMMFTPYNNSNKKSRACRKDSYADLFHTGEKVCHKPKHSKKQYGYNTNDSGNCRALRREDIEYPYKGRRYNSAQAVGNRMNHNQGNNYTTSYNEMTNQRDNSSQKLKDCTLYNDIWKGHGDWPAMRRQFSQQRTVQVQSALAYDHRARPNIPDVYNYHNDPSHLPTGMIPNMRQENLVIGTPQERRSILRPVCSVFSKETAYNRTMYN